MTFAEDEQRLTPRQLARRNRILVAAHQLVAQHGYDGVSMRAIAQESGVVEKTLYNIFGTKTRLIALAARHRSIGVFEEAAGRAPEGGWAMLFAFIDYVAELTLQEPVMARALAPVLMDTPGLVGLDEVYDQRLSGTIALMAEQGLIDCRSHHQQARLLRLMVVATLQFWAREELADSELAPYLELNLCQMFLPLASGPVATMLQQRAAAARALLDAQAGD